MASNHPRPTKAERREAARAMAQKMRAEQARKERRKTITRRALLAGGAVGALGVVGVGVGVGTGLISLGNKKKENEKENEGRADRLPSPMATPVAGMPAPVNADGSWTYVKGAVIGQGSPEIPLLEIYFDYSCGHCAKFDVLHADEINTLLAEGAITLVLHPCKILGQPWTDMVMNAMGLVLDQAPDSALDFHESVMTLRANAKSALTTKDLMAAAEGVGVSTSVTGLFQETIDAGTYSTWVETSTRAFQDENLLGTPTVMLDGQVLDLATLATADALTRVVKGGNN